MQKGDIDNRSAPVVVVDIDGLFVIQPQKGIFDSVLKFLLGRKMFAKWLVSRYKINYGLLFMLDYIYKTDVSITLFAHRPPEYFTYLTDLFTLFRVPHSQFIVGGEKERELILARSDTHWYFYSQPEHAPIGNQSKGRFVSDWTGVKL